MPKNGDFSPDSRIKDFQEGAVDSLVVMREYIKEPLKIINELSIILQQCMNGFTTIYNEIIKSNIEPTEDQIVEIIDQFNNLGTKLEEINTDYWDKVENDVKLVLNDLTRITTDISHLIVSIQDLVPFTLPE